MLAAVSYRSYHGATTVWAFVVAVLIVLLVGWYVRRRR
ncbi:LPXTG cell wall anchor domain-containing protein [Streptomyces sp. enrichment culture]